MYKDVSGWEVRLDPRKTQTLRSSGQWRNRTIADDARDCAAREPDRVCIRDTRRAITFTQALTEAENLAAALWSLGLRPGDVASFQLPNWIESAIVNLAAALLGLVVNPIVPIYRDSEVGSILGDSQAKVLFIPDTLRGFDHLAMVERLRGALPHLAHIVVVRGAPDAAHGNNLRYEDLVGAVAPNIPWPSVAPDAVKLVMYTSGTTGRAKGVLHTHETIARANLGCMQYWRIAPADVILMPSPVTHVTGYLWGLEAPFCSGNPSILMERWNADEAVDLIDRHGVTMTVSATTFLQELLDAAERAGSRLPSMKVFACGGAAVPAALIRRANAYFENGRAFRVYGATEVLMIGRGCMDASDADSAADTDGKIVDFEVRFVDERGNTVADGAEGEILARGPAQCVGYANTEETCACFDEEGFFHTGDLGYRTKNDAIVITGRKKDLIIRGGENISAKEIEDILSTHPAIREVAAVSMPHTRLGETVCAFVIPGEGRPTLSDLTSHLEKVGLARQKFPEWLEIVEDFPRTPAGKVKKNVLREIATALDKQAASTKK